MCPIIYCRLPKNRTAHKAETSIDGRLTMDQPYQFGLSDWKRMEMRSPAFSTKFIVVASPRELWRITDWIDEGIFLRDKYVPSVAR